MSITYWWSEDRKWFCILADDGVCKSTVSLTQKEAHDLADALHSPKAAETSPGDAWNEPCTRCRGTGSKMGQSCPNCSGLGVIHHPPGYPRPSEAAIDRLDVIVPLPRQDNFNGDNDRLIACIEATLKLDADNALVPHGLSNNSRKLLQAAAARLDVKAETSPGEALADLKKLEAIAERQKSYFATKQREFPCIEDFTDDAGKLTLPDDISPLLKGAESNGRYSESDWWLSTIRTAITATEDATFYGAQCPSYPACSGGCGLGCTHDVKVEAKSQEPDAVAGVVAELQHPVTMSMFLSKDHMIAHLIDQREAAVKALESQAKALSEADDHIQQLQRALSFWMPGVTEASDIETNGRVADDAYLLMGYNGPISDDCWGDRTHKRALAAEARLIQIEAVCTDNKADNCRHQLALRFIKKIAARAQQESKDA